MKIPTFEEANQALIEKRGTPLDKFVAYWEPAGNCEEEKFREMLQDLLEWHVGRINADRAANPLWKPDIRNHFWNPSTERYEEKK